MDRLPVRLNHQHIYDILVDSSFDQLGGELGKLPVQGRRACIVTDSCVSSLYLAEIKDIVESCFNSAEVFIFPAGEKYKNLDTVRELYRHLIENCFDRHDFLIALGGGVTGDLCGFAAATYLRGIPFVQIPTTLLSQVDSSIGGKTGVDFEAYKNMVGAFHMPSLVYTNTGTLDSLPEEQFTSGMGEIIKHGLIKSKDYYNWVVSHAEEIRRREKNILAEMIIESDKIKRDVVERDPKELGERALLNFGHTLGHAIEKLADFQLLHGHCVGLGCIAAASLSLYRGFLSPSDLEGLKALMRQFDMPVHVSGISADHVIAVTKNDKKMDSGTIRFVLLEDIGNAYIDKTVTADEMSRALSCILDEPHQTEDLI